MEISDTKKTSKAFVPHITFSSPGLRVSVQFWGEVICHADKERFFLKALFLAVCSTAYIIFISCCSNQSTWSVSCFVMPNGEL